MRETNLPENILPTDKSLFHRIAEGDEQAFRVLFDRYRQRLLGFVFEMTSSASASEEIIQDIFLKIWVNRTGLMSVEHPANYVFIITRNRTMDHLRKVAADKRLSDHLWALSSENQAVNDVDLRVNARVTQEIIDNAVAQLPEQKQFIFTMSRKEGWTNEEIATHLQLSRSRVANVLVEVMKHLRTCLNKINFF